MRNPPTNQHSKPAPPIIPTPTVASAATPYYQDIAGTRMKRKMAPTPQPPALHDDDDDMFIRNRGTSSMISFYANDPTALADEDDDEDDEPLVDLPVKPVKRRRRKGHTRHAVENVIDLDADDDSAVEVEPSNSVFRTIPNDAAPVVDVDALIAVENDAVNCAALRTQQQAQHVLAIAKQHLTSSLEDRIAAEAARDARVEAARIQAKTESERSARLQAAQVERAACQAAQNYSCAAARADSSSMQGESGGKKGAPITLRVRCGDKSIKMKIHRTDSLRKMLPPFCKKFGLKLAKAIMEVDGEEVDETDTADTYDLEDNCLVDVRVRK